MAETEIPTLVRTPMELKAARAALGLSTEALARMVLVDDGSSVRRWEAGTHAIPGPVTVILETAMDFVHQKDSLSRQLEMLRAGELRTMSGSEDTTGQSIARVTDAIVSLDKALATLTRQPPPGASNTSQVHWYTLRRLTPKHRAGQRDEWSLPGETSPERALAYFQRDAGFSRRLEICESTDPSAEFQLEQHRVLRMPFGASQRLRAGEWIKTFRVREVDF
jgi:hypothetical protein